jgi:nucleoside 2-deoxyribosyltransferase
MRRTRYWLLALAWLAISGLAHAQDSPPPTIKIPPALPKDIESRFRAADLTNRGGINKTEAAAAGFAVEDSFETIDTDQDHIITLYEIGGYLAKKGKAWADADTDHDGNVTRAEADKNPSLAKIFTNADRDGDGIVRKQEYEAFSTTTLYQNVDLPYVVPNIINKKF